MSESDGKLNCTSHDGPISVDADIAGYGVLSAFLASAMLTVCTVALAYLSGSLGDESMTDFDRAVIKYATRLFQGNLSSLSMESSTDSNNDKETPRSAAWKHAVSRFILALSDQQLVTGLAILVSGVINQKTLTAWEFYMVLSLAWFSTTSHLATLDALRTYFQAHTIIREVRVFGMLCVLAFLLYTFVVSLKAAYFFSGHTYPIQCVIIHQLEPTPGEPNVSELFGWAVAISIVVYGYCTRILSLYLDHGLMAPLWYRGIRLQWNGILKDDAPDLSSHQALQVLLASSRTRRLSTILDLKSRWDTQQRGFKWAYLVVLQGRYSILGSFFMSLNGVAFSLSYGITQLVMYRWVWAPPLEDDIKSMGFGQIMAVFLLILPFLAAAETYYDYLHSRTEVPEAGSAEPRVSESGIPDRASPYTSSTPISQTSAAERVIIEYVNALEDIKKYLAGDVYYIRHIETRQEPSSTAQQDLIEKKRAVLIRYQRLIECERHIHPQTATVLLIYAFTFSISLGVMLNLVGTLGGFVLLVFGVMLGIAMYLRFGDALEPFYQRLKLVSLEPPEIRSQESNHSEGGEQGRDEGNAFELDEIATARRTATVLLEGGELH